MEIPEIQYQPGQVSPSFDPVEQVDVTQGLRENQQRTAQEMQANLSQLQRNSNTQVQNVRDQAFPIEQLTELSNTAAKLMDEKVESMKSDLEAEMTALAYQDGVPTNKAFDDQEKELKDGYKELDGRAGKYQQATGDYEGAERIRGLSGWKKYYYAKAQAEMAGKGFGAWLNENAGRKVPVPGGVMVSLKEANAEQRAAVVAYLSSEYMRPFQGMNKSFLGKYLFPGMQQGQTATVAALSAERQKLLAANRLDEAKQNLFASTNKGEGMLEYRDTRRADGTPEATIRAEIVDIAGKSRNKAELDSYLDQPYGPNGQTFRQQYPREAQEAVENFYTLKQSAANNNKRQRQLEDTNALESAMAAVAKDNADGSFDADPRKLAEYQAQAEAAGHKLTAKYWESQIAETAYMKNSETLKKQYEMQIAAGVIPSQAEILQNTALSQEHKQALLNKSSDSGKAEPDSGLAKTHKEQIKDHIKIRGEYSPMEANDPGIGAMEAKAWAQYTQDYNAKFKENGGDANGAAIHARNEFLKEFNKKDGEYRLVNAEDVENDDRLKLNTYFNYDRFGETAVPVSPMQEIRAKTQDPHTASMTIQQALSEPDLYYGEDTQLDELQKSFKTTGVIGTIPPVYYELQQQLGGKMSIYDLVNQRLVANGLDPLPDELNEIIKPVEAAFDEESYKYISYKPNATRTDIGLISSGQEPVYSTTLPTDVASDQEFQLAVQDTAQRLGVSEADLMAVMSFETGGTFNPAEANKMGSGATGLIQFMPRTAEGLGTSTEELAGMSRARQMHYVEKFLSNKNVSGKGLSDLYMAVLFPAAVGKSDDFVLFGNGAMDGFTGTAYSQNRGLDKNGDGSITKAEAAAKVMQHRNPQPWRRPNNMRPELQ